MSTSRNDLGRAAADDPSADPVEAYAYLWDGPDPGLRLYHTRWHFAEIALVFTESDPSIKEIAALRSALPTYAARSAAEILSSLRGCERVALGTHLTQEANEIADRCVGVGLAVEWMAQYDSHYVPSNDVTESWLIIEDNELSWRVCDRAVREGIRVVNTEA